MAALSISCPKEIWETKSNARSNFKNDAFIIYTQIDLLSFKDKKLLLSYYDFL
jgi:hypothetical protein